MEVNLPFVATTPDRTVRKPLRSEEMLHLREKLLEDNRSQWKPIDRNIYTQGSIGHAVFMHADPSFAAGIFPKHVLDDRPRSPYVLRRPLRSLWSGSNLPSAVSKLPEGMSIDQFFRLPYDPKNAKYLQTVTSYIQSLAISPAKALICSVLHEQLVPVTNPDDEKLVEQGIEDLLTSEEYRRTMRRTRRSEHSVEDDINMFVMRYGLHNGIPQTYDTIGYAYGLDSNRIIQRLAVTESALRYPKDIAEQFKGLAKV